jgi:hypothetical protein
MTKWQIANCCNKDEPRIVQGKGAIGHSPGKGVSHDNNLPTTLLRLHFYPKIGVHSIALNSDTLKLDKSSKRSVLRLW